MTLPWDDPNSDPLADLRAFVAAARDRGVSQKPSHVYVGKTVWDLLGPEKRKEAEDNLSTYFGWPIKIVLT